MGIFEPLGRTDALTLRLLRGPGSIVSKVVLGQIISTFGAGYARNVQNGNKNASVSPIEETGIWFILQPIPIAQSKCKNDIVAK